MRFSHALAMLMFACSSWATEPETRKLPSGVTVQTHRIGSAGSPPRLIDVVRVHYHGTLSDGTVFDSSYTRGTAAELPLEALIPCWKEVLQTMTPDSLVHITCPPETAYGRRGVPGRIPRNATLGFVIELIEIKR